MTQENFERATELAKEIVRCREKIDRYNTALINHTIRTCYSYNEINVQLYNGNGKSTDVYVDKTLVAEMLNKAIDLYKARLDEAQAEFDGL